MEKNRYTMKLLIVDYMVRHNLGKYYQISYSKLLARLNHRFGHYDVWRMIKTKDELRGLVNEAFEDKDYTLVSTAKGVFVAETRQEIIECAERLKNHALGELRRYSKLMKLPNDYQLLVDYSNMKIREIDRTHQQALFDLDETLFEISKDREDV
jgi:hypothetical protein